MADLTEMIDLHLEGETAAAARQLATLRGVSVPDAVGEAVRHNLEQERLRKAKVRRIVELGLEIRAHLQEPDRVDDEWLYDRDGLPA